uniref:Uncharacterized protein n=1 Tax=viral metagenome TaxID=1070528 RepID=A0A2V0R9J4_9ZZZZ
MPRIRFVNTTSLSNNEGNFEDEISSEIDDVNRLASNRGPGGFGNTPGNNNQNRNLNRRGNPRRISPSAMDQSYLINAVPNKVIQTMKWSNIFVGQKFIVGGLVEYAITFGIRYWTVILVQKVLFNEVTRSESYHTVERSAPPVKGLSRLESTEKWFQEAFFLACYIPTYLYEKKYEHEVTAEFVRECENIWMPLSIYRQIAIDQSTLKTFPLGELGLLRFLVTLYSSDSIRKVNPNLAEKYEKGQLSNSDVQVYQMFLGKCCNLIGCPLFSINDLFGNFDTPIGSLGETVTIQTSGGGVLHMLCPEYSTTQSVAFSYMYATCPSGTVPYKPEDENLLSGIRQMSRLHAMDDDEALLHYKNLMTKSDEVSEVEEVFWSPDLENPSFLLDQQHISAFSFTQTGWSPYALTSEIISHFLGIDIEHPVVGPNYDGSFNDDLGTGQNVPSGPYGSGPVNPGLKGIVKEMVNSGIGQELASDVLSYAVRVGLPGVGPAMTGVRFGKEFYSAIKQAKSSPRPKAVRLLGQAINRVRGKTGK